MLEIYSTDLGITADTYVPFQNVALKKGCTAELSGTNTITLNKCGVYMVSVDASATVATTLQLYKDGIAQPQAQATGTNPSFVTLIQVSENNSCCPCASGTDLQIMNGTETVLTDINCTITKVI